MMSVAYVVALAPVILFAYAYVAYPAVLWLAGHFARTPMRSRTRPDWPTVTLTLPVYNEERNIRAKLDDLLQLEYPADKLQILVLSDASTDATERIVEEYASRGVELVRLPRRRGKTAAENAAASAARGSIIVNSDAAVRVPPAALKALVAAFDDPAVGVASGRDVSVGAAAEEPGRGESQYVGFEMWLRRLETRLGSIVGASGCFYGIRARIYDASFPEELDRDFSSALMARAHGMRAVSVDEALCYVPRAGSLQAEFRRKVRTMARGLETLWVWRRMLNPGRYGSFAFMLFSHKLCRWLVYLSLPFAVAGLLVLAPAVRPAAGLLAAGVLGVAFAGDAWRRARDDHQVSRFAALAAFALASVVAGMLAWLKFLRRQRNPIWEPTRRPV